jgi:hypothetical protein
MHGDEVTTESGPAGSSTYDWAGGNMKKFLLASLALAAALAITPTALADAWTYTITGSNFTADLTLITSSNGAVQTVTAMEGTFDIVGNAPVNFGLTPTEPAAPAASANNLTLSNDGEFLFDNLLYTTAPGNQILDWGGLLINVSGYELNIFGGYFGGSDGTYAPGDAYFYFADNGSYHSNNQIPKSGDTVEAATATLTAVPEPGSVFLLGTGILGLALFLLRKASGPSCSHALNA